MYSRKNKLLFFIDVGLKCRSNGDRNFQRCGPFLDSLALLKSHPKFSVECDEYDSLKYEEEDFKYEKKPDFVDPDSNRPGLNEERLPSGGNQVTIERDAGEDLRTRTDEDLPDCEASYFSFLI